jgi:endonuclease/exonuclease/phosphatase family metal-dependent hydrolase
MQRILPIGIALGLMGAMLSGCGGGGGGSPTPPPGPTSPPTPAPPPPMEAHRFRVVTYNLYWWCTSDGDGRCPQFAGGKGFQGLYDKVKQNGPFDLVGMQECEDAMKMGTGFGYGDSHEWHQGPTDIGMGYNKSKFEKIGDFQNKQVSEDQWGKRYLAWVRLKYIGSDATVFFGNTHGALPWIHGDCDGKHGHEMAKNYIDTVKANIQPGDAMVVTGDFNCMPQNVEIWDLNATWNLAANDKTTKFDHIYMINTTTQKDSSDSTNGHPSDHSILWADLSALTPIKQPSAVSV